MNGADYFLIALVLLALILALRKCVRDHKQGKSCGCGCSSCDHSCGKQNDT